MPHGGYPPRPDLEYDEPVDGFPEERCGLCGGPSTIRVRWWETVQEPAPKRAFVRAGRSESHFFCGLHRAVSWRVYARFTTMRPKPVPGGPPGRPLLRAGPGDPTSG